MKKLPKFVIFEGFDGSGKTTYSQMLYDYYKKQLPNSEIFYEAFPGKRPGTLGEFIYRFHHNALKGAPATDTVAYAALQILHVAAHIDIITQKIKPTLKKKNGYVILDRYWWSLYAYARQVLSKDTVMAMAGAELAFWKGIPDPVAFYIRRNKSLKEGHMPEKSLQTLKKTYIEVVNMQKKDGVTIHIIDNEGTIEEGWESILTRLC